MLVLTLKFSRDAQRPGESRGMWRGKIPQNEREDKTSRTLTKRDKLDLRP